MVNVPALQPILDSQLDASSKGFPLDRPALRLGDLGALGLRASELDFPVALLKRSALEHNARWMAEFTRRSGASLCPHGKTTMAPQLFHRQLADGAWGITLATLQQVRTAHRFGIKRVLLANEALLPSGLRWLQATLDADADFDCTCLVDSLEGVARLEASAQGRRPIPVLVELGLAQGRTGVRGVEAALAVARAVKAAPRLQLRGVECYEGILGSGEAQAEQRIRAWLDDLAELARRCARAGLFETDCVLVSAGGSAFFDLVVTTLSAIELGRPHRVLLRSGCYFSHDVAHYRHELALMQARLPEALRMDQPLAPALEVWGQVLSRPEPGLAFLGLGKRDVGADMDLPVPIQCWRPDGTRGPGALSAPWRITRLFDQHARLELDGDADLRVGDLVGCGISHPCTTFDKWQVLFEVDDQYRVLGAVRTFF